MNYESAGHTKFKEQRVIFKIIEGVICKSTRALSRHNQTQVTSVYLWLRLLSVRAAARCFGSSSLLRRGPPRLHRPSAAPRTGRGRLCPCAATSGLALTPPSQRRSVGSHEPGCSKRDTPTPTAASPSPRSRSVSLPARHRFPASLLQT